MRKVSDILARKGTAIVSVQPNTSVFDALTLMAEKNIGSVVVKQGADYLGILTERDYARKVILQGKHSTDTLVEEIMSTDLPHITPDVSIDACMQIMSDKTIRYLPVFNEKHELYGIISINDVIDETIISQKETIEHLHNYIQS
jgi:CBS domain-containing protein